MSSIKNISNIIDAINSSSSPEQVSKTYIEGIKKGSVSGDCWRPAPPHM